MSISAHRNTTCCKPVGRVRQRCLTSGPGPRSLDFLRGVRIKNAIEKFMDRSLFSILPTALSLGLVLLVTGCGEDRYSAKTPYLGGVYGGEQAGPPRDTVSYWDGDNASGSPSVKISLGEQRAYFYKSGVLVGVSQLST